VINLLLSVQPRGDNKMTARLLETNKDPLKKIDVDGVTVDIIENALRNAREEMDAVLFRTAMSPGIASRVTASR